MAPKGSAPAVRHSLMRCSEEVSICCSLCCSTFSAVHCFLSTTGGGNPFRAHKRSAFQTPQRPSRIASLGIEESMEPSQVHSQLPDISFSSEMVPSTQFYPSSMSPFGNTFSSLMHAALFEPPPGLAVSVPDVQAPAIVASSHAFQQQMAVPVAPVQPTMAHPHVNSPSVVSPAPGARVSTATSTSLPNAGSNTRKRKSSDIWSANEVNVLLDLYEDKWISLNRGNFKAKH
ncbi:hypothetical protein L7F22_004607 [Adiantum nelumboides]|nr:hypothetical protein [Adiantum nelumboides]